MFLCSCPLLKKEEEFVCISRLWVVTNGHNFWGLFIKLHEIKSSRKIFAINYEVSRVIWPSPVGPSPPLYYLNTMRV